MYHVTPAINNATKADSLRKFVISNCHAFFFENSGVLKFRSCYIYNTLFKSQVGKSVVVSDLQLGLSFRPSDTAENLLQSANFCREISVVCVKPGVLYGVAVETSKIMHKM